MASSFTNTYGAVARNYLARPRYPAPLFEWLAQQARLTDLAWDCACGSGQASHDLARYFSHVVASDASDEQIKQARLNPKITFKHALAERSGLVSDSVDLITVFMAAHWFNLDSFYAEAVRVAKAGALIAIFVYGEPFVEDIEINAHIIQISSMIAPYGGEAIQRMRRQYRDLFFPFKEELDLPAQEMQATMTIIDLVNYLRSRASVIDYIRTNNNDSVSVMQDSLARRRSADEVVQVRWPLHGRVGRIVKAAPVKTASADRLDTELASGFTSVV